jgi:hypothetical protein
MRKIITKQWLKKMNVCCSESDMQKAHEIKDMQKICMALLKANRFNDANWLITKILTKKLCLKYAIYAAKKILNIFEEKYPKDARPRKAIQAAEKYLKNPTQKNKNAAYAAVDAANVAANVAADAAAAAAAAAAAVAAYAAAAADVVVYAAAAAVVVYAAAAADVAADAELKTKIIKYGIKLIYN